MYMTLKDIVMPDKNFIEKYFQHVAWSLDLAEHAAPDDYVPALPSADIILKEGYCHKHSIQNPLGNWRRRFFKLEISKQNHSAELIYSETFYQSPEEIKRTFIFSKDVYIDDALPDPLSIKIHNLENADKVMSQDLVLSFDSKTDKKSWMNYLTEAQRVLANEQIKSARVLKSNGRFFEAAAYKKNHHDDRWMERFFELDGTMLRYRDAVGGEISGQLSLVGNLITVGNKLLKHTHSAPTPYLIRIKNNKTNVSLIIACRNRVHYLTWLEAITQNIECSDVGKRASQDLTRDDVSL